MTTTTTTTHKTAITWSSYSTAQRCRRAYWYTYCEGIELAGSAQDDALVVGDAVHRLCAGESTIPDLPYHLGPIVAGMVGAWLVRWGEMVVTPDREIEAWRTCTLLVEDEDANTEVTIGAHCDEVRTDEEGDVTVVERKTASRVDKNYLDRLALDQQIAIQAYLAGTTQVIYDVITKPPIRQSVGETEEQFVERKREAARKNKSGKSSIRRREPETIDEYSYRIAGWYREHLDDAVIRYPVTVSTERALSAITQVLALGHELAKSQRVVLASSIDDRAVNLDCEFPQSTQRCFDYGRRCEYWDLCVTNDQNVLKDSLYQVRKKREGNPPTNQEIT